jgi:hypothetical protein
MANLRHAPGVGRKIRIDEDAATLGRSTLDEAFDALDAGEIEEAKELLESGRVEQQLMMDHMVDWAWGMLTWVQRENGEQAVERIMRDTLGPYVASRYGNLLDLTFDERVALTIEAMRGHLSGPGRRGSMDVDRTADRVVISFDPCGTGGNARRGDPDRGIAPATERPELGFSSDAHDWTWNEEDVCLYCSHCALVNEILPIETLGFPLRVTDYPKNPGDKCRWTLYADPADIPAIAYERVGKKKPSPEELDELLRRAKQNPSERSQPAGEE